MKRPTRVLGLGVSLAFISIAAPLWAWSAKGPFRANILGHAFDRLEITSSECSMDLGLYFDAPADAYTNPNPVRNAYQFRALITLSDGQAFETRVFRNRAAGRRKYLFSHDTTAAGCWAKSEKKVVRVEVNGCRNRGCVVPGF